MSSQAPSSSQHARLAVPAQPMRKDSPLNGLFNFLGNRLQPLPVAPAVPPAQHFHIYDNSYNAASNPHTPAFASQVAPGSQPMTSQVHYSQPAHPYSYHHEQPPSSQLVPPPPHLYATQTDWSLQHAHRPAVVEEPEVEPEPQNEKAVKKGKRQLKGKAARPRPADPSENVDRGSEDSDREGKNTQEILKRVQSLEKMIKGLQADHKKDLTDRLAGVRNALQTHAEVKMEEVIATVREGQKKDESIGGTLRRIITKVDDCERHMDNFKKSFNPRKVVPTMQELRCEMQGQNKNLQEVNRHVGTDGHLATVIQGICNRLEAIQMNQEDLRKTVEESIVHLLQGSGAKQFTSGRPAQNHHEKNADRDEQQLAMRKAQWVRLATPPNVSSPSPFDFSQYTQPNELQIASDNQVPPTHAVAAPTSPNYLPSSPTPPSAQRNGALRPLLNVRLVHHSPSTLPAVASTNWKRKRVGQWQGAASAKKQKRSLPLGDSSELGSADESETLPED
ncbi:hypothetical protein K437DRAFT_259785 [Tilletiaria anomala UBC 951]|uniref:Uncharacterized protein n=1 Tax=Tilletiaria anomala (strain ATCC 24038 / CBS 436.72 / UBC 951) TaxID=1037660 RepID=A0A066VFC2_TILAU|nr:uncharacterized protein K437DRAFT_259785 [Tilletiaria anomala UBC 951]KDN37454.1 hypothetical protein K437DRAFT_259785 [Tilletiaria anomala UBC 951]